MSTPRPWTSRGSSLDFHDPALNALAEASRFYRRQLGGWVYDYLRARGLEDAKQLRFGLGYAPSGWSALVTHLRSLGYTDDQLLATGIIKRTDTGVLYDLFRDRMVLPIVNTLGQVVSFTGRRPDGHDGPKWLNGSATEHFDKSVDLLACVPVNDQPEQIIVVEGAFDLIAAAIACPQAAIYATGGTAFSERAANALREQHLPVITAFDCDTAGVKATRRAWDLLPDLSVADLSFNQDPADILLNRGATELAIMLTDYTSPGVVFLARTLVGADDFPEQRLAVYRHLAPTLERVPQPARDTLLGQLRHSLDLIGEN